MVSSSSSFSFGSPSTISVNFERSGYPCILADFRKIVPAETNVRLNRDFLKISKTIADETRPEDTPGQWTAGRTGL